MLRTDDWGGLVYTFSTTDGEASSDFGQLFTRLIGLAPRRPDLFDVGARAALSIVMAPPMGSPMSAAWIS